MGLSPTVQAVFLDAHRVQPTFFCQSQSQLPKRFVLQSSHNSSRGTRISWTSEDCGEDMLS